MVVEEGGLGGADGSSGGRGDSFQKTLCQFDNNVPCCKRSADRFNTQVQEHLNIRAL